MKKLKSEFTNCGTIQRFRLGGVTMALEGLSERLQQTMQKIRGKGKVTEADVKAMMREVRLALLYADVNIKVVKDFINTSE